MKQHHQHRVDIVGRGSGWDLVDYDNEVWAVSTAYKQLRKADKVFQLHKEQLFEPWLKGIEKDVVLLNPCSRMNNSFVLPTLELNIMFGKVFHSSVAWMFGYAIMQGYRDIGIIGINMEHGSEYGAQRDSMFFLIGWARSRGINVRIPKESGLYLPEKNYQE